MRKVIYIILIFIIVVFLINNVEAINLKITTDAIQNNYIVELNEPAIFNISITNYEDSDNFEIYSLVGINIEPKNVYIKMNETKTINLKAFPQDSLKEKRIPYNFIYKIKNSKGEIIEDSLSMNIIGFESSFTIFSENINSVSDSIIISLENNLNFNFENINIKINSAFFDFEKIISLKPRETIQFEIPINKDKAKILNAGKYLMNTEIIFREKKAKIESEINFVDLEKLQKSENKKGFLVQRIDLTIKNVGNVKNSALIKIKRNLISYLFTTINIDTTESQFEGFNRVYVWERNLLPNEELAVSVTTNWIYPLIILIMIILGVIFIRKSIYTDLILRKKVSFVKTRGGHFALKISVIIKAKKFVERIKITDKLPRLVELYDKFGMIPPDHVDKKNRRLEWNIESLNKGESRIFTYIIYSKIGVVGRFELPSSRAIYEKDGKIKESTSNRSFYVNEPKKD